MLGEIETPYLQMKNYIIIYLTAFLLTCQSAYSQTILDYFIPEAPYNKVTTFMPDRNTGLSTGAVSVRYYVKKGNKIELVKADFLNNEFGMKKSSNFLVEGNTIYEFINGKKNVYLKLPEYGKVLTWKNQNETYEVSFVNIKIGDENNRAIKKITKVNSLSAYKNDYYRAGIGFWSSVIASDKENKRLTNEKFDKIEVDETIPMETLPTTKKTLFYDNKDNFPFKINIKTYDKIVEENSNAPRITDTTLINAMLTPSLKRKLIAVNQNSDLLSNYSFVRIGERKINDLIIEFFCYLFDGEGIQVTTIATVKKNKFEYSSRPEGSWRIY